METLPYQAEIAARMNVSAETVVPEYAEFFETENGYWLAWYDDTASVLPPDFPENEPCDVVEGADSLAELVSLIESGDYEALLAESFDDEHEHSCGCGCSH
ncbi:hypothetical protein [Kingella negevensis]|uniref:hypothetical protein n=1 Tax=Kingella negevensis TaxID=1522312 RepID=UPI00050A29F9|nr:hypothetical protein [Kingella negevensis]MDK4688132.1 hypothetical protein [Kingella negevensis]WII90882.1 hypothetical protein QEO93_10855 [Kingella negevensis]